MKYKKIKIESDGTSAHTKIFVDGKQLGYVQRIEFAADVNEVFSQINIQMGRSIHGDLKVKKIQVRDPLTQKFVEKIVTDSEPLILERDV